MMHLIKFIVVIVTIGYLVYIGGIDFHVLSQVVNGNYLVLSIALIIFLLPSSNSKVSSTISPSFMS